VRKYNRAKGQKQNLVIDGHQHFQYLADNVW